MVRKGMEAQTELHLLIRPIGKIGVAGAVDNSLVAVLDAVSLDNSSYSDIKDLTGIPETEVPGKLNAAIAYYGATTLAGAVHLAINRGDIKHGTTNGCIPDYLPEGAYALIGHIASGLTLANTAFSMGLPVAEVSRLFGRTGKLIGSQGSSPAMVRRAYELGILSMVPPRKHSECVVFTIGGETTARPLTAIQSGLVDKRSRGLTNAQVANRMDTSENVQRVHTTRALKKLNAVNMAEAVAKAIVLGIITFDVAKGPTPHITKKELAVASLVPLGLTSAQIGERLNLFESTVVRHLTRLFVRFGAKSRENLVRILFEHQIFGRQLANVAAPKTKPSNNK